MSPGREPTFTPQPGIRTPSLVPEEAREGWIERPRRRKIAIVGTASTWPLAPYAFADEWEIWGENYLYDRIPRFDRWFETHRWAIVAKDAGQAPRYTEWLAHCPAPVYMIDKEPCGTPGCGFGTIPTSVRYPLEDVVAHFRDYFTSTFAHMMGLILLEHVTGVHQVEEIGMYGIEMVRGQEYVDQRPCAEYWLGQAEGRGIRVTVPDESALLKHSHRYGFELEPELAGLLTSPVIRARLGVLRGQLVKLEEEKAEIQGAVTEWEKWLSGVEIWERGTRVPAVDMIHDVWRKL